MRPLIPCIALLGALGAGCHPCPEGVYYGGVRVLDNRVMRESLNSQDPLGTTGDSPISACRELTGGVTFTGAYDGVPTFPSLERVGGSIGFTSLDEEVFADFPSLRSIGGRIYTSGARFDDMYGFDVLEDVDTIDFFSGGPEHLHSMGTVQNVSRIVMYGGPEVMASEPWPVTALDELWMNLATTRSLRFLNNVESVTEDVSLTGGALNELGLERLERIGGSLEVARTGVTTLEETANLRSIGENVTIVGNSGLRDADVTDWLEAIDVGGEVRICNNGPFEERTPCPPLVN